ncbi:MAG TPA: hypothetical protein VF798_13605 [Burkholderiaceae bacterium]
MMHLFPPPLEGGAMLSRMCRFFLALQHETHGPVSGKPLLATIVDNWWLDSNGSAGIPAIARESKRRDAY